MKLRFLPPLEDGLWAIWAEYVSHWFSTKYAGNRTEELVVVFPQVDLNECLHDSSEGTRWNEIYRAWYQIKNSLPGTRSQAWHVIYKYGDEVVPNLSLFRLRDSNPPCLFWLCSKLDFSEAQARLADLLPRISAYWHITQGRGLFHAAGVLHKGQAYLFVGASGAGKSTVSSISSAQGDRIIHDDHVVLYRGEMGKWLVSDTGYSLQGTPVKALLFLVQDHKDQLHPIKPAAIAKYLLKSLREHGNQVLYGDVLRQAFVTSAEIARHVPGYELHFQKKPNFWKLIDEQFPD